MGRKTVPLHLEVGVAAFLLGMSRRWVKDQIKTGELEGYLLGNRVVVTADSVNALLEKHRISPRADEAPGG